MLSLQSTLRVRTPLWSLVQSFSAAGDCRRAYQSTQKSRGPKKKPPKAVIQGKAPTEEPSWTRAYEQYEKPEAGFKRPNSSFRPSDALKWETRITYLARWQWLERRKVRFTHVFHDKERAAHHVKYTYHAFEAIYGQHSLWHYPVWEGGRHKSRHLYWVKNDVQLGGWKKGMSLDETVDRALGAPNEGDAIAIETEVRDRLERYLFMRQQITKAVDEWNFAVRRVDLLYPKDKAFEKYSLSEQALSHQISRCLTWNFRLGSQWRWLKHQCRRLLRGIFV